MSGDDFYPDFDAYLNVDATGMSEATAERLAEEHMEHHHAAIVEGCPFCADAVLVAPSEAKR